MNHNMKIAIKKLARKKEEQSHIETVNQNLSIINARLKIIEALNKQIRIIGIIWLIDVLTVYSNEIYLGIYRLLDKKKGVNSIKNVVKQITDIPKKEKFNKKITEIEGMNKNIGCFKRHNIIAHSNREEDDAELWNTKLVGEEIKEIKKIFQELKKLVQEINLELVNNNTDFSQHDFLVEECKASLELVKKFVIFHRENKKLIINLDSNF